MNRFKLIVSLSIRNLWRQRRRNSVLVVAIVIAVCGVIVLNSLIRGMMLQFLDTAVENFTGHVKIHAPGFRDDPSIERGFSFDSSHLVELLQDLPTQGWAARINIPAVVMSEREARGLQLVGIDPIQEDISFVSDIAIEGSPLTDTNDSQIVIGRELMEELKTKLGRRIVVATQTADGSAREIGYRIVGVYDAESNNMEEAFALTGRAALQKLLGTDQFTELSIRFNTRDVDEDLIEAIRSAYPDLEVLGWKEFNPMARYMVQVGDVVLYVWLGIVMGALVFGLVNTLITAVLERTEEFGLFRALGMRPPMIVWQVVSESLILMIVGVGCGLVVSLLLLVWLGDGIDLSAFAEGVELMGMAAASIFVRTPKHTNPSASQSCNTKPELSESAPRNSAKRRSWPTATSAAS